ncbi:hypothetical protein IRP63_03750 [Clostridium botulinum]|nr:hypothetical protein IRP63_03750 [Clostridium botulinum]
MYFNKNIDETLKILETDGHTGLTSQEIKVRQEKYGLNKLASEKKKLCLNFSYLK